MRRRRLRPFRLGLWLGILAAAAWFVQRLRAVPAEAGVATDEPRTPGSGGLRLTSPDPAPAAPAAPPEPPASDEPEAATGEPATPADRGQRPTGPEPEPPAAPVREVAARKAPAAKAAPTTRKAAAQKSAEAATKGSTGKATTKGSTGKATTKGSTGKATTKGSTGKAAARRTGRAPAQWVSPNGEGICPPTHPIKGKRSSGLYHAPGMAAYARTRPDRCYTDETAAEADGLRRAKR